MSDAASILIRGWLGRQVPEPALVWLDEQTGGLAAGFSTRALYTAIGLAPRKLGKEDLRLEPEDLDLATKARPGWDPSGLSVDAAARILILRSVIVDDFPSLLSELCRTAEVSELIAFYRGLPLYPEPKKLVAQACEGLRTNMRAVFESVAHRSPFPAEQFTRDHWNQMVLKALFVESPLFLIQRLDERSNPELAAILCDYAHERWAAGRSVPVELWRLVGPHADENMLKDLSRAFESELPAERMAAALAISLCKLPAAKTLLDADPHLRDLINEKRLSWADVMSELSRQS